MIVPGGTVPAAGAPVTSDWRPKRDCPGRGGPPGCPGSRGMCGVGFGSSSTTSPEPCGADVSAAGGAGGAGGGGATGVGGAASTRTGTGGADFGGGGAAGAGGGSGCAVRSGGRSTARVRATGRVEGRGVAA